MAAAAPGQHAGKDLVGPASCRTPTIVEVEVAALGIVCAAYDLWSSLVLAWWVCVGDDGVGYSAYYFRC
jgi:hypothetical protein